MNYRIKLLFSLISVAVVSVIIAIGILFFATKQAVLGELRSKARSIAATTAVMINPDQLKELITSQDESSLAYKEVKREMRKSLTANRRPDLYVRFIYILYPDPKDQTQLKFLVDSSNNAALISHLGDNCNEIHELRVTQRLNEIYSPSSYIKDRWGEWLAAFAPVYDNQGNYVATVAVDISADDVKNTLAQLINYGMYALCFSVVVAVLLGYFLSTIVTTSLNKLCSAVEIIGKGDLTYHAELETSDEFQDLANAINKMTKGLRERESLKTNFSRYVSEHVLEKILSSEKPTRLEGERRKITVLFSDIRHFTLLAEKLPPERVLSLLNEYFDTILEVVFANQGTLDKFLGDGMMVDFGAPLDDYLQEEHAALTGIQMLDKTKELSDKWEKEGKPRIQIGIGIHTGLAVVGTIGSDRRMEYTAIGDTVNVASRLQNASKTLHHPIILSETTYREIKDKFSVESLGSITLPGREGEIAVFALKDKR